MVLEAISKAKKPLRQCEYRNHISRLPITKEYHTKEDFSRSQVKCQGYRVTRWHWHIKGLCHFVKPRDEPTTKMSDLRLGIMLWKPRFGFNFGFHDRWRSRFMAILDDCEIGRLCQIQLFNYFCDSFIDNITLTLLTQDKLLALWLIRPCSHSNLENVLVMFVSVWIDFRHRGNAIWEFSLWILTMNV